MPSRQVRTLSRVTAVKYGLGGLLTLVAFVLVADLVTLRLSGTVTVVGLSVPVLTCLSVLFASVVLADVSLDDRSERGVALTIQGAVAVATLATSGYSFYDLNVGQPGVYWSGALTLGLTGLLVVTVLVEMGVAGVRRTVSRSTH